MTQSNTKIDPRAQRTRTKALAAARELLVEGGPDAVTHLRIAKRTGIGRNTLYRHWPEKEKLLVDTITMEASSELIDYSGGTLRENLISEYQLLAKLLNSSFYSILVTLIERSEWSEKIRKIKQDAIRQGASVTRQLLQDSIDQGHIRAELDVESMVTLLAGPLVYRRLMLNEEISDEFVEQVVDLFLANQMKP